MDEIRLCIGCDADLVGPFQPKIALSTPRSGESEESEGTEVKVSARSWICPGCGLVHWHIEDEHLEQLREISETDVTPKPGQSYQRRMQMLQMLKRVRRM